MLGLSADAASFVRGLREQNGKEDHLLRIASGTGADSENLRVALVPSAEPGDDVGESQGVAVCVASELSADLDDKLLDVTDTGSQRSLVLRKA
jgi:Fe-S cluster assembly iron-binding protein IscA